MIRFLWTSLPSRTGIDTLALRWSPVRFHTLFESMALEHPLNRSDKKAKYEVLGSFHLTSHLFVSGILITLSYHPTYVVSGSWATSESDSWHCAAVLAC